MLSGNGDLTSEIEEFTAKSSNYGEQYYTPNTQINKTSDYNEMDFARIQNGEKKQPDYIVAFRRNNKTYNIENIVKASKDWEGKLPVIIVDVDKCLESERAKVDEQLAEYAKNPTEELLGEIRQKVRNNRVTDSEFCTDIQQILDELAAKPEKINKKAQSNQIELQELSENYDLTTATERKNGMERLHNDIKLIIRNKEESERG